MTIIFANGMFKALVGISHNALDEFRRKRDNSTCFTDVVELAGAQGSGAYALQGVEVQPLSSVVSLLVTISA